LLKNNTVLERTVFMFKKVFTSIKSFCPKLKIIFSGRRKYFIIGIIIILITSGGYYYYKKNSSSKTQYQTETVQKGMITSSVSGSGNMTVDQEESIKPTVSGTVSNLKVSVGDQVEKGQFLFYIESPETDISLTKSYASYTQAVQSLQNAQTQYLQNQLNLSQTNQNTEVTKAASSLLQAEQSLESAYTSLLQANSDYNKLIEKDDTTPGSVTTTEITIADEKAEIASIALKAARQNYIDTQASYNQALANSGINQEIAQQQLVSSQAAIDTAQLNVDAALASYNNEKTQASKRTVRASISGMVTTLNIKNGDTVGGSSSSSTSSTSTSTSSSTSASSSSSSSSASMVIDDLSTLKASVAINEADISKVQKGQKTTLTFDAITDLTLTGKVEKINQTGTNSQNVITYNVTIGIDELNLKVKPQMNVSAEIVTEVKQNVLYISASAVKTSGNTHYVQIMKDSLVTEQSVEVGISNDTDIEVTSGLSEGDTVITQTVTTDTAKSSSSSSSKSSSSNRSGPGGGSLGIPGL